MANVELRTIVIDECGTNSSETKSEPVNILEVSFKPYPPRFPRPMTIASTTPRFKSDPLAFPPAQARFMGTQGYAPIDPMIAPT